MPRFGSENVYKGRLIHSNEYKDHSGYEDKTVVVVGIGNSGGDIAVELSRVCKMVYLATRRGSWVFNRVSYFGYPMDILLNTRHLNWFGRNLPRLINLFARQQLNARFDHKKFG